MGEGTPQILLVDDEPLNVEILQEYLADTGYAVSTAADGLSAWDLLEQDPQRFDVVILDRTMPGLSGIQVLQRIKRHPVLQSVPVILQTALAGKAEILEGLQAGAHYHLAKPFDQDMLLSVLSTAVEDRMRYRSALHDSDVVSRSFGLLQKASFTFRTLESARDLATVLANAFPEPRRVIIGLSELLVNAVEHGNLGISYEEKTRLRNEDRWEEEVARRLADPRNAERVVEVCYTREAARIRVTISDQGQGFDWRQYLQIDPTRALDTHGRGIVMSRMLSFDELNYHGCGNEVEVIVRLNG